MSDHPKYKSVDGGVTAAQGFVAAGIESRIRYHDRPDIGVIFCSERASAAGVFTQNAFAAAPVLVCKEHLAKSHGRARALVVNAGNANACTGRKGWRDAHSMAAGIADRLKVPSREVLVASTGVIGEPLPMDRVHKGIIFATHVVQNGGNGGFAASIMTTDTFKKELAIECEINGEMVRIGGCSKGVGMIAPNMATMLAFVTTDAKIAPALLQQTLQRVTARTFNRISVDGDESTNDSLFVLASGLSANVESHTTSIRQFEDALEYVCGELAKMNARDGEGATRLIEVQVRGAKNEDDADRAARTIANSPLVKTAVYGADANWGRIFMALGYSGAQFDPLKVGLSIGGVEMVKDGVKTKYSEDEATKRLKEDPVILTVNLNAGNADAIFWTCDLTEGYIRENASYRS
ncbi:MAG: bifunctional glutamate N-acetyltransferase/amino-acid acetyltransferase ArgJ [Candidatus Poribacteria bacterium]|nr:bifunctional glutamate N-acetyltransferase/amino-acid acetyltransferase ArgJ [Candidatus Poribacteria bacterium]